MLIIFAFQYSGYNSVELLYEKYTVHENKNVSIEN